MTDAWDGRPQNPERDGWHWLKPAHYGHPVPVEWFNGRWCLSDSAEGRPEWVAGVAGYTYLGPCLTPDEIEAREAATAEAMREACAGHADGYDIDDGSVAWRSGQEHAAKKISRRVRNTPFPAADALARALAQARAEEREDADVLRAAVEHAFSLGLEGMDWLRAWWGGDPSAMAELDAIRARGKEANNG